MGRKDHRGRRVNRRTLCVDLGEDASLALEDCLSALNSKTWASIRRYHSRPFTRGHIVRLAVLTLLHHIHGECFPLHMAARVPVKE